MSLFDNIPEGTDIIEIRKKVNKMKGNDHITLKRSFLNPKK